MKNKQTTPFTACYLFADFPPEERDVLCNMLSPRSFSYKKGDIILASTSFTNALVFVTNGSVEVRRENDGHTVLLNILRSGDTFGAASMFGNCEKYPTTVLAKTDASVVMVEEAVLASFFLSYPRAAISHIRFLSDKIRFLNEKIDSLSAPNVESKVAKFLLERNGKQSLHSGLNMKQIASSLAIGRASLYRVLERFTRDHLISCDGSNITIIDEENLRRLV